MSEMYSLWNNWMKKIQLNHLWARTCCRGFIPGLYCEQALRWWWFYMLLQQPPLFPDLVTITLVCSVADVGWRGPFGWQRNTTFLSIFQHGNAETCSEMRWKTYINLHATCMCPLLSVRLPVSLSPALDAQGEFSPSQPSGLVTFPTH